MNIFSVVGALLLATPIWYAILMEVLFRFGIGYRRCGSLRRMRVTEWLSVTGIGIFLGIFVFPFGRLLLHNPIAKP